MPWLGYFLKMASCDIFVFHDDVEITKGGPTRRAKIMDGAHENYHWLTVPLQKHSDFAKIKDLCIDESKDWRSKHLRAIEVSYRDFAHFDMAMTIITDMYNRSRAISMLSELNIFMICEIANVMNISVEYHKSSDLPVQGKADEYNAAIVSHLGGKLYLSGVGGKRYHDPELFKSRSIEVQFMDSKSVLLEKYDISSSQLGLSVIDVWMRFGIS